jgi:hypothetical protein
MKRSHGSGHLYVKRGSYSVRWRGPGGRRYNRRLGKVRVRGEKGGLSKAEAERAARGLVAEFAETNVEPEAPPTVDEVASEVRARLAIEGARLSYRENCARCSPAARRRRLSASS